jgi:hypothetical protein
MLRTCALAALFLVGVTPAHAETRAAVRFGVLPLDLEPSADTPLFGDDIARAVTSYNTAAAAYDRMHGTTTDRISASDLALRDTLVIVSPGLELGAGGPYFFRLEAPLGFGSDLRSLGAGIYPLNLQTRLVHSTTLYGSAGGTLSYLDRTTSSDDLGALLSARLALGVRFSHALVEVGYNAATLGGTVDSSQLAMPTATRPPPRPDAAVAAGQSSRIVDVSVGVSF